MLSGFYICSFLYMQFLLRMLGIILKKILVHVWEVRPLKTTFATLDEQCWVRRVLLNRRAAGGHACQVHFLVGNN